MTEWLEQIIKKEMIMTVCPLEQKYKTFNSREKTLKFSFYLLDELKNL